MRGCALLLAAAAASCGGERVPAGNLGFEEGLSGWTTEGDVAAEAASPHGGASSARGRARWSLATAKLPVAKGRPQRVEAWLRASVPVRVVVTAEEKGRKDVRQAAVWDVRAADWTRYEALVVPRHEGRLTLRFAAEPEGEGDALAWIDDVSVAEASLPVPTPVEPGLGFDDEPVMARAADGTLVLAWISFRKDRDTLQTARFRAERDGTFTKIGAAAADLGAVTALAAPRVLEAGEGVVVRAERDGQWRLLQVLPEVGVVHDAGECVPGDPAAGVLGFSRPAGGRALLHAECVEGNWDLYLRDEEAPREARPVRLTSSGLVDRNPVVVARGAERWVLYESVTTPGYRVAHETDRRVVVAKLDGERLLGPRGQARTSPLLVRAESPAAAFDDQGRLWVTYRKPRLPTAGWEVWLAGWTGSAWTSPVLVAAAKGMDRASSVVVDGDRAIVCFQADDLPEGWGDIDRAREATSGVWLVSVPLPAATATPHELEPLVEPDAPWEARALRQRFGDDAPARRETVVEGERLVLLAGDLHAHSDTSVCDRLQNGSGDEVYAMQRDFLNLDFACLTDHGEDMNPYLWARQGKIARFHDVPGRFTTFLGLEWTSGYDAREREKYFGHRNVILGDLRFGKWWNPRDGMTPAELWADLRASRVDFVTIPHQLADAGNAPTDWRFADPVAEPVAEVFQIRGAYEEPGGPRVSRKVVEDRGRFLQGALARGVRVGVIASPDHGGGVGKAMVWAKENSRASILAALRARRCYGTTGARIALEVRAGGVFMGGEGEAPAGPIAIEVKARCPGAAKRVSLCRSGTWIAEAVPSALDEFTHVFTDADAPPGPRWYYVRVEQTDGEIAWSSPIWLD